MRIQHNIPAMSSYRNYTNNVSALSKNLEKLSSGYKINRAGDDAAGLAISEKMRAQITGLEVAQKNAKDGISLVQTAEGALTEVHDMLNRMYELAEQSANGTYQDDVDREQLQKELNQLRTEVDRIADSSNFNGIKLLDGSLDTSVKVARSKDMSDNLTVTADGQLGKKPQAGVYSIDLSNAKLTAVQDGAQVTFEAFQKSITIAVEGEMSGDVLAKQIVQEWNDTYKDAWNGKDKYGDGFQVTADARDGKIILSMSQAPSKEWTEFDAKKTLTFTNTQINGNNGQEITLTQEKEAIDTSSGRMYGQAEFNLTDLGLKDGSTLTIGNETYVFAIGPDSKYKDLANAVDLTDTTMESLDNDGWRIAANRLSTVAKDNRSFLVGTNNNKKGAVVSITEKEGGVDYAVNNLAGTDGKGAMRYSVNGGKKPGDLDSGTDGNNGWAGLVKVGSVDTSAMGKGLSLQIGDTAESFNKLKVSINDCHVAAMGLDKISIASQDDASNAMSAIKNAINYVSDVRGTLGATQNRLDHTINNLSVMQENIQDAESTIRDVDVAKEMMDYTKNNILVQSAQAMLAQANQLPQGVLQLLQ